MWINLKQTRYILTFNFTEQVLHTIKSIKKPEWLEKPNLFLLDNSTKEEYREKIEK